MTTKIENQNNDFETYYQNNKNLLHTLAIRYNVYRIFKSFKIPDNEIPLILKSILWECFQLQKRKPQYAVATFFKYTLYEYYNKYLYHKYPSIADINNSQSKYNLIDISFEDKELVQSLMEILEPKERDIVYNRFYRDHTLKECALHHNIAIETVRQIEMKALNKMKNHAYKIGITGL